MNRYFIEDFFIEQQQQQIRLSYKIQQRSLPLMLIVFRQSKDIQINQLKTVLKCLTLNWTCHWKFFFNIANSTFKCYFICVSPYRP